MRPCRVCGNNKRDELNAHHLIPGELRTKGMDQMTMKLCRDQKGCKTHMKHHRGSVKASRAIRSHMRKYELEWLIEIMGKDWVDRTYPSLRIHGRS